MIDNHKAMNHSSDLIHTFHIPVMGTAFTIDSPVKVARFGITSVVSIGDDELCEYTREHYTQSLRESFEPITKKDHDYRAKRITAYLNLINRIVEQQMVTMAQLPFGLNNDLAKYFELLPENSEIKKTYIKMISLPEGSEKQMHQAYLKTCIRPGSIDVNIMTKIDRDTYDQNGELLPEHFSDALAALRGYALSTLSSAVEFSAGFNRRLYAYIEQFDDFFPDATGFIKKQIVIKVSDVRSSLIQGKFLAKKGLWISEHRIESGLNCGGHVFPTEGHLMGPILEEFKQKKDTIASTFYDMVNDALLKKGRFTFLQTPPMRITVQGGVGTANEHQFLQKEYEVDSVGWGTPFLLVPEATNVDEKTRTLLATSPRENFYTSGISPLGVRFNTVRGTDSEELKLRRVEEGKPGSPCPKGHLVNNTEFTKKPICTASTTYQKRKIEQLKSLQLSPDILQKAFQKIIDKACLCEDLAASALINHHQINKRILAPAICPGPNMGYFDRTMTLSELVAHIYGRLHVMTHANRPNLFVSELRLYIEHLVFEIKESLPKPTSKQIGYFQSFQKNLMEGIQYYKQLIPKFTLETQKYRDAMKDELQAIRNELEALGHAYPHIFENALS